MKKEKFAHDAFACKRVIRTWELSETNNLFRIEINVKCRNRARASGTLNGFLRVTRRLIYNLNIHVEPRSRGPITKRDKLRGVTAIPNFYDHGERKKNTNPIPIHVVLWSKKIKNTETT